MFDRLISIDWSGAGRDIDRVDIRIAQWTPEGATLIRPPSRLQARSWSRTDTLAFLSRELHPSKPRTAVAFDFAFGLPWRSDRAVFGVDGWHAMLHSIRTLYSAHKTARATANSINGREVFGGHGPYRFNEGRVDFRFYLDYGVAYYRTIELVVPQAISVWYVGSGATVGFHTVTGLACLAALLEQREAGAVSFVVWPQEQVAGPFASHTLIEGYPSVFPAPQDFGPCRDNHENDAWRMLEWMRLMNASGQLENSLRLPSSQIIALMPDGLQRVQFEGWILGIV